MILLALAAVPFHPNPGAFDSRPRTPSPAALARSLASFAHHSVNANNVRRIQCEGLFYDPEDDPDKSPPEYACRWDQKVPDGWRAYSSFFGFKDQRWVLTQKPDTDMPANPASAEERRFREWVIPHLRTEAEEIEASDKLTLRYGYALVDLNNDGQDEALVWEMGDMYCGNHGCDLEIEVQDKGRWHSLCDIGFTEPPIEILPTKQHGWHDIAVFDTYTMPHASESAVRFTGKEYEDGPTNKPLPKKVRGWTVLTYKMVNRPLF